MFVGGGAGVGEIIGVGSGLGVFVGAGLGVFVGTGPGRWVGAGPGWLVGTGAAVEVAVGAAVRVGAGVEVGMGVRVGTGVNVGSNVEVGPTGRGLAVGEAGPGVCVALGVGGSWSSGTYPTIIAMGLGLTDFPFTQPDFPSPKEMRNHPPCRPVATTF